MGIVQSVKTQMIVLAESLKSALRRNDRRVLKGVWQRQGDGNLQDGEALRVQYPVDLLYGSAVIHHVFENMAAENNVKGIGRVGDGTDIHPDFHAALIEVGSHVAKSD